MMRLFWWSETEKSTLEFGETLGRALVPPAWIGLTGPLGAGKTRLIQGIARGLGFGGPVRSPTFVLEHRYRGRHPILHLDLYRLEAPGPDLEASWEEEEEGIVLVEWSDRVPDPPVHALSIAIYPQEGPAGAGRWIRLEWDPGLGRVRDLHLETLLRRE
jgi:tRNA threonylcarbamoyladenosine biosynthesis protein TsaE